MRVPNRAKRNALGVAVLVGVGLLGGRMVLMSADAGRVVTAEVRAPEFPAPAVWLNTDKPLTMAELRGQVILLDFWTYCCINCMHVLPDLAYLEDKYRDEPFVVIGVHTGKFDQERDARHIRQAILRHNIRHPVVVDSDYEVWSAYGVEAWPTLVLVDPSGYVVGKISGEGHRADLDAAVGKLLNQHRRGGTLGQPLRFRPERASFESGMLEFPGKVRVDAARGRLFISDTNHHRVLVTDLTGKVQHVIGAGTAGLKHGSFAEAQFHQPQGLEVSEDGHTLYVADTENHAVRTVDLQAQTVKTLAGTGAQSYDFRADGPGRKTPLSSPWDLARVGRQLYIAMAGTHQIWVLDLDSGHVRVFAGTGREACIDGPNRSAAFAQPSGLATDGKVLYVADSEVSSIRVVDLDDRGQTRTLAGSGGLFDFGLRDGRGRSARFQHPLGVTLAGDRLFVADTFNNAIRAIDVHTGEVSTWLGPADPQPSPGEGASPTGETGSGMGAAFCLVEPGGLSFSPPSPDTPAGTLYIADTNHHRVLAVDVKTRVPRPAFGTSR
ncbi:MAG TPA: thioredoxin-like domain-containing protein [Phycisphaerae bacterium]|nr:thioredoxin-like domain-containing protein [Phycisphaerae bacterium]HNU47083.1 thioredoxin-like domain-containing protein [Phycisphaerae bacterium]